MRTEPRYKRWTQHWRVQSRESQVLSFTSQLGEVWQSAWAGFPASISAFPRPFFACLCSWCSSIWCRNRYWIFWPPSSGYYSQDVTVMLVESVGGDSWVAEPEQSTAPSLSPTIGPVLAWTAAVVSLLTPLLQLRMLSHVLHEVWVAYFSHPPLGPVFAVSPGTPEIKTETCHRQTVCFCQPASVSLCSHTAFSKLSCVLCSAIPSACCSAFNTGSHFFSLSPIRPLFSSSVVSSSRIGSESCSVLLLPRALLLWSTVL